MEQTMTRGITFPASYTAPRLKLRFPSKEAYWAARSMETDVLNTRVADDERLTISVSAPAKVVSALRGGVSIAAEELASRADMPTTLSSLAANYGAAIEEDFRFDLEQTDVFAAEAMEAPAGTEPSLPDVLRRINLDSTTSGDGTGVAIAVVDTGITGTRPEFVNRSSSSWAPRSENAWKDWAGHGTMCATIAAASDTNGGTFRGIAPGAEIIACRTYFFDTELTAIYTMLRDLARDGKRIVATNSYGFNTGTPPAPPATTLIAALEEAIDAGVFVVFSAGNNHELAGGHPDACDPNSIWQYKCRADVLSVGTCKLNGSMWEYSSRGPGEFHGQPGMATKPDVIAPTPENGVILFGSAPLALRRGWGTSGAAPQVAGLAALLWSRKPAATATDLRDMILETAEKLGNAPACEGAGMINCSRALGKV